MFRLIFIVVVFFLFAILFLKCSEVSNSKNDFKNKINEIKRKVEEYSKPNFKAKKKN